jgi:endonuclease/exonuclease/phosphatase family metal-dependent hydrolase
VTGTALRVVSYNVHGLRGDRSALASVVRELAPDVAVIQEAPRRFRWRQKCAHLARSFGMVMGGGGLPALGNLVLTNLRVRSLDSWSIRYPLTPGRHMRGAVFVRCRVGREPFVIAGSHLSTDAAERPGQAVLLKKHLAEVPEPLIFAGDVQENSGGGAWRTVADGLVDTALAMESGHVATFPAGSQSDRIDAVFVDPRWTVVGYRVVDSELARAASDHLPVVVDLAL